MAQRSWQTSWAGLTTAIGAFLGLLLPKIWPTVPAEEVVQMTGYAMTIIGIIWFGVAARDDNVSSEGTRARKALKMLLLAMVFGGLVLPAVTIAPGCATMSRALGNPDATAREQYRDAVNAYDLVVGLATVAIENDVVDLETAEAMGRAEQVAYDELVVMRRSLENDSLETFGDSLARFRRVLAAIRVMAADNTLPAPGGGGAGATDAEE